MPKTLSFATNGMYWFIFIPSNISFKMKTDLNFNPVSLSKGLTVANPNTTFSQNYTVYCNNVRNAGTVTYTIY